MRGSTSEPAHNPRVSLLISAYNEQNVIQQKIENSLALTYPKDRLEIMVISDGSDDATNEIIKRYQPQGVVGRIYGHRRGKTGCLNESVEAAKGDIVVFSDANAMFDQNAIRTIVNPFSDAAVGFVSGRTRYVSDENDACGQPINLYWKIEAGIKAMESRLGSCIGADGAIFAIRKRLYIRLEDEDLNDLVIPLRIFYASEKRGAFESNAVCWETRNTDEKTEFRRQIRIACRTLRAIFNNRDLLNPVKYPLIAFQILSHKVSRLLVPFFMGLMLLSSAVMGWHGVLYRYLLLGQVVGYIAVLLFHMNRHLRDAVRGSHIPYTFVLMNIAFLYGWMEYLRGKSYTLWSPARSEKT